MQKLHSIPNFCNFTITRYSKRYKRKVPRRLSSQNTLSYNKTIKLASNDEIFNKDWCTSAIFCSSVKYSVNSRLKDSFFLPENTFLKIRA